MSDLNKSRSTCTGRSYSTCSNNSSNENDLGNGTSNDNNDLGQLLTPSVATAATILRAPNDASNSPPISRDDKKSVGVGQSNEVLDTNNENESSDDGDDDDEVHGEPASSANNTTCSSEKIAGPSEYELRRLANMKRNEDRLKQLGLDGTWKDQMKKRAGGGAATSKRMKRSIPEPSRKSQRDKKVHDYKRLSNGY